MRKIISLFCIVIPSLLIAQSYKQPVKVLADLVTAKATPAVSVNDKGTIMLISERSDLPTIEDLAQPELRIAGLRINPNNFAPSRLTYSTNFLIKNITTGVQTPVKGLPYNCKAFGTRWNPSQTKIAFLQYGNTQIDLYVIDVATAAATKWSKQAVNVSYSAIADWLDDNTILYSACIAKPVNAPKKPLAPNGPVVQENYGKAAPSRTYQDLIKNAYDEALFEFYATAQLVKNTNGVETKFGKPGIYNEVASSADGNYFMWEQINKPYSYLVPASGFNSSVFVTDAKANVITKLADLPSSELAPSGFDNVLNAPRGYNWLANSPNTLMWIEPLDSGIMKKNTTHHDAIYFLQPPFKLANKTEFAKTTQRCYGLAEFENGDYWLTEGSQRLQKRKVSVVKPNGEAQVLFDRSTNDFYGDPGSPVFIKNKYQQNVIKIDAGNNIYLTGAGSSPKGDLPFLNKMNIASKATETLWKCSEGFYETVVQVVSAEKGVFVTSKQSPTDAPNFLLYENGKAKPITNFTDPQPALRTVTKQKIQYKRKDGVDLTADVYLPQGYNAAKDGRLPIFMWAYPREFKQASDAAQVRGSKYTFTRVNWGSPVFWATQGYAVMDNTEFPIVGEGDKNPNDNFIEQLTNNAQAALDIAHSMGFGDTSRAAVGGHSYGAFMTANLLAHTRLFKAGIARSGAYNRTLTPFGFQNEERTYWEAPEVYNGMSPFSYANKVKDALLLIHGEADNNPGTFPIQSERLYNAIKGHGGNTRFVILPYESHGYAAKENILHMLWEMDTWLGKWLKGK
jgi:dipeptidyl aminopeptidase/acylaminoacyl peptidase